MAADPFPDVTIPKRLGRLLILSMVVLACLPPTLAKQQQSPNKPEQVAAAAKTNPPDIESKLSRKADFFPEGKSTVDQLVAIAQHYEIPMGIEWIKSGGPLEIEVPLPTSESNPTVRDLLQAIVSRLPDYQLTVDNGVVHVAPPVFAVKPENLLNLIIEEFRVKNENLFDADHKLRLSIDMTLHPEKYEWGYVGGYGYGPGDVLAKYVFSLSTDDASVREILDGLVKVNGNALWIAEFDAGDFKTAKKSVKATRNKRQEESKSQPQWRFLPLSEK